MKNVLIFSLLSVMFIGCATTINLPLKSKVNDFVMFGTKTNSIPVNFQYESNIKDGVTKVYYDQKDTSLNYNASHSESSTLKKMLSDYMMNKFSSIDGSAQTKVKFTLKDMLLEQEQTSSSGEAFAAAMIGGEINYIMKARITVNISVEKDGIVNNKNIVGSSEGNYIKGIGTGTSTSNVNKGAESHNIILANAIDDANNKVLMLMNKYFEEIGL